MGVDLGAGRALLLVLVSFATACERPPRHDGPDAATMRRAEPRVIFERFPAAALGVQKTALVVLPEGYRDQPSRRFPVVYFLHGFGGTPDEWENIAPVAARAAGLSAILVFVDGDDSFYVNWVRPADFDRCMAEPRRWGAVDPREYCVRDGRYEDYVVHDVIGRIDARYRTIADRTGRAIVGFSMGGYGALVLAMRHPDAFRAVASHAGIDSLSYLGPRPYDRAHAVRLRDPAEWGRVEEREIPGIGDHVRGILGSDLSNWLAHDPVTLAGSLRDGQLAIYFDCGTDDVFHFDDLAKDLHDTLERRGIGHTFVLVPGGRHDSGFLLDRLDDGVRFVGRALATP